MLAVLFVLVHICVGRYTWRDGDNDFKLTLLLILSAKFSPTSVTSFVVPSLRTCFLTILYGSQARKTS